MLRSVVIRHLLAGVAFGAALTLSPSALERQPDSPSADARLRALYTEEWNWRRKELARGGDQPGDAGSSGHFPRSMPRTTLAANVMPDGDTFYQAQIVKHTTLNLTAKQIHDIGLKEVARLKTEMEAVKQKANFKGTMAEFLPRRRHGIRPVPDAIAPIFTGGRGGLDACLMNTYNLPARPLYTLAALTLHECTPGHSFQAALALEGPERPPFRRGTSFSGYGEGWALPVLELRMSQFITEEAAATTAPRP